MKTHPLRCLLATAMLCAPACFPEPGDSDTDRSRPGLFEQTDVFVAGQDGVAEFRIPVLLTSTKGTLLAFCDARVEKPGDPPNNIDLVMKRSTDQGRTWGPLRVLLSFLWTGVCCLVGRRQGLTTVWWKSCAPGGWRRRLLSLADQDRFEPSLPEKSDDRLSNHRSVQRAVY